MGYNAAALSHRALRHSGFVRSELFEASRPPHARTRGRPDHQSRTPVVGTFLRQSRQTTNTRFSNNSTHPSQSEGSTTAAELPRHSSQWRLRCARCLGADRPLHPGALPKGALSAHDTAVRAATKMEPGSVDRPEGPRASCNTEFGACSGSWPASSSL